jgi:hypothetical protein
MWVRTFLKGAGIFIGAQKTSGSKENLAAAGLHTPRPCLLQTQAVFAPRFITRHFRTPPSLFSSGKTLQPTTWNPFFSYSRTPASVDSRYTSSDCVSA